PYTHANVSPSTDRTGQHTRSHAQYEPCHSHIKENGPSTRARFTRDARARPATSTAAATAEPTPSASQSLTIGASRATRTGPLAGHATMSTDAGSSHAATATPRHEMKMTQPLESPCGLETSQCAITAAFERPPCSARSRCRAATCRDGVRGQGGDG